MNAYTAPGILPNPNRLHNGSKGTVNVEAQAVIQACCDEFGVTWEQLNSRNQQRPIVQYRQLTMQVMAVVCPYLSLNDCGRLFSRDHSTVLHSRRQARNMIQLEPFYKDKYNRALKRSMKLAQMNVSEIRVNNDYDPSVLEETFRAMCRAGRVLPEVITQRVKTQRLKVRDWEVFSCICYLMSMKMKVPNIELERVLNHGANAIKRYSDNALYIDNQPKRFRETYAKLKEVCEARMTS